MDQRAMELYLEGVENQLDILERVREENIGDEVGICTKCYSQRDGHDFLVCRSPRYAPIDKVILFLRHKLESYTF